MARAGTAYDYKAIQGLLDASSASMAAGASLDYSTYSLTALDKYFGKLLPVWANTLVSPAFTKDDFDQVLSDSKLALQSKEKDPWQRTGLAMNAEFFAGHPYAPPTDGTKASLDAASLEAVKAWYATRFSADRIFVVASGDFDPAALKAELEAAIGAIPDRKAGLAAPPPRFAAQGPGSLVKSEYAPTKGVAYVRGDFPAPSPADPDFMAANVAMKMFSDLLFNVVRDQHGAVYTPSAYIRSFIANYGSITLYKTNQPGKVKAYVDEAAAEFASGKVLATQAEAAGHGSPAAKDAAPRTTIEEALEVYKAQYVNAYYGMLQTNAAVAGLIAQSVVTTGDCRTWLLDGDSIKAVTAEGVKAAAAKYLFGQKITWVALSSKEGLVPVVAADYEKLGR
jgi:zinc protease